MSHRISRQQAAGITGVMLLLLIWAAAAALVRQEVLIPGPMRVLQELFALAADPQTPALVAGSILRWLQGFGIALFIGILTGSLGYRYAWFADAIRPLIITMRAIPVIAIILIALVWLPLSHVGILVGIMVAYPLIYQGVLDGLRTVDFHLIEMGRVFRVPIWKAIKLIYLPGSLPVVLTVLISAVGMSWKAVIAAEVLSQPARAIGTALQTAKLYIDTPRVFAWTIIAVLFAALADGMLMLTDRWLYMRRSGNGATASTQPPDIDDEVHMPQLRRDDPVGIETSDMSFRYPGTPVFSQLNCTITPGEITVVFGPSGCGKTTLLRLLAGLLKPDSGSISRSDTGVRRPRTSFVFQDARLLPWANVQHNLEAACEGMHLLQRSAHILSILQQVRVPLPHSYPEQLSGGMQQRINLARGFLHPAGLICLDEPFANQDKTTRGELMELALNLHATYHPTMIWVTHDPYEAISVADRIILLSSSGPDGTRILADYRIAGAPAARREIILQSLAT